MASELVERVRRFMRRERMLQPGEPVHAAVSGGVDSMVLLHVLRRIGHPCSVLHADHGLRGAESDADRAFVEAHCERLGIPFRTERLEVATHAAGKGISVQMAARELRYAFFDEAMRSERRRTALAHHQDDAVETLLIHLMRGAGASGWAAIPPVNGAYIRPLLAVPRAAIERYAAEEGVAYREDRSNTDPKYLRNRIRHELLPLMEAIRPGAGRALARSVGALRELQRAGEEALRAEQHGLLAGGEDRIPFAPVERSAMPMLLLNRLLRHRGFHPDQLDRLHDAILDRTTGAEFVAGGWRAVVDREAVILGREERSPAALVIHAPQPSGSGAGFRWSLSRGEGCSAPSSKDAAVLDADRLHFPLELRPWRPGDRIRPIGLRGSKLVSDILIDAKVPKPLKDSAYVLVDGDGTIAWLAGHRVGEGYQATPYSERVLTIIRG